MLPPHGVALSMSSRLMAIVATKAMAFTGAVAIRHMQTIAIRLEALLPLIRATTAVAALNLPTLCTTARRETFAFKLSDYSGSPARSLCTTARRESFAIRYDAPTKTMITEGYVTSLYPPPCTLNKRYR